MENLNFNDDAVIGDMIDERLPEGLDDESRADDLTKAITEILPTLNLSLSVD